MSIPTILREHLLSQHAFLIFPQIYWIQQGYQAIAFRLEQSSGSYLLSGITCSVSSLPVPANGFIVTSSSLEHRTVDFSCNTGYYLVGERSLYCTLNGTWNAAPPTCEGKRDKLQTSLRTFLPGGVCDIMKTLPVSTALPAWTALPAATWEPPTLNIIGVNFHECLYFKGGVWDLDGTWLPIQFQCLRRVSEVRPIGVRLLVEFSKYLALRRLWRSMKDRESRGTFLRKQFSRSEEIYS